MSQGTAVLLVFALFAGFFIVAFVFLRVLDSVQRPAAPPTTLRSIVRAGNPRVRKPLQTIAMWKGGAIAGGVIGLVLLLNGFRQNAHLARGSATPQRVQHDDLVVRGPGDNIHVTITDFTFARGHVVEEDDGTWKRVWIPMNPARVAGLNDRRVVVRTNNIRSKADLEEFYRREEVTGIVVKDTELYNYERNELLRERNRGYDPDRVLILAEGESFPTRFGLYFQFAMAALFLAFGAFSARRFVAHAGRSPEGVVAHALDQVDDPDHQILLLDGHPANGRFKTDAPRSNEGIRETLFGDMPLSRWPIDTSGELEEPWNFFMEARILLQNNRESEAVDRLRGILEIEDLESRHYLQAWHFLRQHGVQPQPDVAKDLLGVVVEVGLPEGLDLLAAYAYGTARYYNFSGAGVVWDRPDGSLESEIERLLASLRAIVREIGPWEGRRPEAPTVDQVRISMLTPSGLHLVQAPFEVLAGDPVAGPALTAATALMERLIEKSQQ